MGIIIKGTSKSGIAYQRPMITGQLISYRTGDDYWQQLNNPYNAHPTNPTHIATLVDHFTLENNNEMGNLYRFTDQAGNQAVFSDFTITTSDTIIDHLTGLEWGFLNTGSGNDKTWIESIDECSSLTAQTFSDWYLPNVNEYLSVMSMEKYTPISTSSLLFNAGRVFFTSSTNPQDTLYAITNYTIGSRSGTLGRSTKTSSNRNYYPVRKRY